ncbi:sialic acid-binding Ig-like lectin 13 [Polypterus senegalus]|uniref:sialic acid-binding Ig-like lectin 13 n=1 Tax=Polypterus senegalus TaxID=55291 RepID=UPI001962872E|nr:sialic acid-binding Ig-like lectin 13 [Polypterus senegalus]
MLLGRLLLILYLKVCFFSTHCRKEWRVTRVPEKLSAVRGSCVVIPCMVYLPAKGVAASRITAIWRMADHGDVFNSRGAKVLSGFMGRTALLGNVADQNCSLQIQNLRHEDNGSYYFRIEVKGLNNYSFINNMVTLQVTDTPETPTISHLKGQKVGDVILLSCSTFHWCPSHPPTMTWNYTSVNSPVKHTHVKDGMWQLFSLLYFVAVKKTLGSVVTCTVEYPGGARARASVFLQIKYKPEILPESGCLIANTSVTCHCLVDSYPPADIKWFSPNLDLPNATSLWQGRLKRGILQKAIPWEESITCSASNPLGEALMSFLPTRKDKYVYVAITAAIVLLAALTLGLLYFRRWRKIRGTSCATRSAEPNSDVSTTIYEKPEDFKYEEQNKEEDYESMQQGNLYENIELSARNSKCATDSNDEASE